MISIKVKVSYSNNPDEIFEFVIDSSDVLKPNFTQSPSGQILAGGRVLTVTEFQSLIGLILSVKKWLEAYGAIKVEIEQD